MAKDEELMTELAEQEQRLQFGRFDDDTAWALGVHLVEAARAQDLPVTVSVRRNGQRLFHAALAGSAPDDDLWLERTCRVVDRFSRSSFLVGEQCRAEDSTFQEHTPLDPNLYAAHGGAFPITLRGTGVIGTVAVSGLSQAKDHAFLVDQLSRFLERTTTARGADQVGKGPA